jgi:hypothetical protein
MKCVSAQEAVVRLIGDYCVSCVIVFHIIHEHAWDINSKPKTFHLKILFPINVIK